MDTLYEGEHEMEMGDYGEADYGDQEISQEDAWVVINAYFDKRGLVKQQLDSYDQFILSSIQEMVDDQGQIVVTPENQYIPGREAEMVRRRRALPLFFLFAWLGFARSADHLPPAHPTPHHTTHTHTHTHTLTHS